MFTVPLVCTGSIGTSTCHMALSHLPVSPGSKLLKEGSVSGAVGTQPLSREQKLGFSDLHTRQDHLPRQERQMTVTSSGHPGKVHGTKQKRKLGS